MSMSMSMSTVEPRPSGTPKKKVALIGKGLTFDSGGYNIKVSMHTYVTPRYIASLA